MEKIPVIKFFKHKYGGELLIDLNDIDYIKPGIEKRPVHRYGFYCLILVTAGREEVGINDETITAERGTLLTGIPGDVWRWKRDTQLHGYVLGFEEEFLLSFFNDRSFLQKFPYLQRSRRTAFYRIGDTLYDRIRTVMEQIRTEIHGDATDMRRTSLREIDRHLLRAMLYETLALLKRGESTTPERGAASANRHLAPFIQAVEKHFSTERNVRFYADLLCITPNYLNKLVKQAIGMNAKGYINHRTLQEIKNLLEYTTLSAAEISERLHFLTPSYFVRYFRTRTGMTPMGYRKSRQTPPQ